MKRKPKDDELCDEVIREYRRLEEQKRVALVNRGQDVNDLGSRVTNMEGSMSRLQEKVGTSHDRLQGMLQQLLNNQMGHANVDGANGKMGTVATKQPTEPSLAVQTALGSACDEDVYALPSSNDDAVDAPVSMEVDVSVDGAQDIDLPLAEPDDMLGDLMDDVCKDFDAVDSTGHMQSVVSAVGPRQARTPSREGASSEEPADADVIVTCTQTEQVCRAIQLQC